jgi:GMP synthase (glutamine-hydrolysing)
MGHEKILILDLGSQYTQLIARRVREQGVYSEIVPHDIPAARVREMAPRGMILSGGPSSVYEDHAPTIDEAVLDLEIPVLGICYGQQLMVQHLGGRVSPSSDREYGRTKMTVDPTCALFHGLPTETTVWMSHGDRVEDPAGMVHVGQTSSAPFAAVAHPNQKLFGLQFHPEVVHSVHGVQVIENFVRRVCECHGDWVMSSFVDEAVESIRRQVAATGDGGGSVVCGMSGGVDSAVTALLVDRALGDRLHCIFVDNGLLRQGEVEEVETAFRPHFGDRLKIVRAGEQFLDQLAGVEDPETKRKRIGHTFIEVFKQAAEEVKDAHFLAQGTLYPDVIESVSAFGGPSAMIKSHHNVGGLPEELGFELVEPLRQLFKDEVRKLAREVGLSEALLRRQPFPGPGLAIRILGEVTPERLAILRPADAIVRQEFIKADLDRKIWQSFAVLLPVRSVGVMGDKRTYEYTCVVRAVDSQDGMTADWMRLDPELLATVSNRIINEVTGINRVCYDISSKPPATIEWE